MVPTKNLWASSFGWLYPIAFACLFFTRALAAETGTESDVDFGRDIRPFLVRSCFPCHGPEKQESGLRLDVAESWMRGGDSGEPVVVPGDASKSNLFDWIEPNSGEPSMPPERSGRPRLSSDEIQLLRTWVNQGAKRIDNESSSSMDQRLNHWSLRPLPTEFRHDSIDDWIDESLSSKNLKRSLQADARTLFRRLHFDLIGLPPNPREIDVFEKEFLADPDAAVEQCIQRLLDSPHYGERWGRHWLDVVRFAESNGFETNQPRPNAWPYRDYVIRSFNEDKPYHQFVQEQIAGDQWNADEATGFLVGGPWDQVKSPDPTLTANQRADELHDMVSTLGSTFLGLTIGCARCHSHKFDPISQTDYYSLKACLEGVEHGERSIKQHDWKERQAQSESLRSQLDTLRSQLSAIQPIARPLQVVLVDDEPYTRDTSSISKSLPDVEILVPEQGTAPHTTVAGLEDGAADVGRSYRWWANVTNRPVLRYSPKIEGEFIPWISWGSGWETHAPDVRYVLDLDGDWATTDDQECIATIDQRLQADGTAAPTPNTSLWSGWKRTRPYRFTKSSRLYVVAGDSAKPVTADTVAFEQTTPNAGQETPSPTLDSKQLLFRAPPTSRENADRFKPTRARFLRFEIQATTDVEPCIDEFEIWNDRGINVAAKAKVRSSGDYVGNPSHRLEHVNDGIYGNEHSWISNESGKGWLEFEWDTPQTIERVSWSRDRTSPPKYQDRTVTEYTVRSSLDDVAWTTVSSSLDRMKRNYPHAPPMGYEVLGLSPPDIPKAMEILSKIGPLEKQLKESLASNMVYAGRFKNPPPTFRFQRGDATQPKEQIAPAGLSQLKPFVLPKESSDTERRMALAEWLIHDCKHLVARVIVNRIWHYHFGQGLVETPSDLGINGARPSHPELLDWLAVQFLNDGWSLKKTHLRICLSQTYRQSSSSRPEAMQHDASNRLHWRFPPRRMEAETIRDSILWASGSLDLRMGGPGFDLFENNTNYVKVYTPKQKFTKDEFRRMVYQSKPRVELDTIFGAFDCPDAGQIQPRRNVSTTPLQALSLLNSDFVLDQSDRFSKRLESLYPNDRKQQIYAAIEIALGRPPLTDEWDAAIGLAKEHGLLAVCRALFNTHEFLTVR